jgi:hypothetical protein
MDGGAAFPIRCFSSKKKKDIKMPMKQIPEQEQKSIPF